MKYPRLLSILAQLGSTVVNTQVETADKTLPKYVFGGLYKKLHSMDSGESHTI